MQNSLTTCIIIFKLCKLCGSSILFLKNYTKKISVQRQTCKDNHGGLDIVLKHVEELKCQIKKDQLTILNLRNSPKSCDIDAYLLLWKAAYNMSHNSPNKNYIATQHLLSAS